MSRRPLIVCAVLALLAMAASAAVGLAQEGDREGAGQATPARPEFPDLIGGLTATPGCLGVETARTGSGKNVIFSWFEDKDAVKQWYYSDMHQGTMDAFFGDREVRAPLADVPDDSGPLLVIASMTMADRPHLQETDLPISQIAIEIYKPVTGGLYLGGRFAPDALKVPALKDYTPASE